MTNIIRKLFLSAIFFWLPVMQGYCAQWASVSSPKAIIYADAEMTSPIGYLKQGQKIRVGEVARNKGRLLPTVYQKRVVYIKVADIRAAEDLVLVRSATERLRDREEFQRKESRVGLAYSFFSASSDSGPDSGISLSGFGFHGLSRKNGGKNFLKLKIDYLDGRQGDVEMRTVLFTGEYGRELFKAGRFGFSVFGGIALTPWFQVETDPLFTLNGYGAGFGGGVLGVYDFSEKYSLGVEANYYYLQVFGVTPPEKIRDMEDELNPSLYGPGVSAVFSFRF